MVNENEPLSMEVATDLQSLNTEVWVCKQFREEGEETRKEAACGDI